MRLCGLFPHEWTGTVIKKWAPSGKTGSASLCPSIPLSLPFCHGRTQQEGHCHILGHGLPPLQEKISTYHKLPSAMYFVRAAKNVPRHSKTTLYYNFPIYVCVIPSRLRGPLRFKYFFLLWFSNIVLVVEWMTCKP